MSYSSPIEYQVYDLETRFLRPSILLGTIYLSIFYGIGLLFLYP